MFDSTERTTAMGSDMPGSSSHTPILVEPLDLEATAAALCCRFGDATAEAYRLATLREVLTSSRALSQALEEFTRVATAHYHGVHCTSDMRADVGQLAKAISSWSESVQSAGLSYREWQDGRPAPEPSAPHDRVPMRSMMTSIYGGPSIDSALAPPA